MSVLHEQFVSFAAKGRTSGKKDLVACPGCHCKLKAFKIEGHVRQMHPDHIGALRCASQTHKPQKLAAAS